MENVYENTKYKTERTNKQLLTIKVDVDVIEKTYHLQENLIIDTLSDIYIDSLITNGTIGVDSDESIYIMGVEEFNIKSVGGGTTKSNAMKYHNKIIIPNTHGAVGTGNKTITHRANKFNFVSSVNPMNINQLTLSLTNKEGENIAGAATGTPDAWATFLIVSRD
jgi:hypothetical protein